MFIKNNPLQPVFTLKSTTNKTCISSFKRRAFSSIYRSNTTGPDLTSSKPLFGKPPIYRWDFLNHWNRQAHLSGHHGRRQKIQRSKSDYHAWPDFVAKTRPKKGASVRPCTISSTNPSLGISFEITANFAAVLCKGSIAARSGTAVHWSCIVSMRDACSYSSWCTSITFPSGSWKKIWCHCCENVVP